MHSPRIVLDPWERHATRCRITATRSSVSQAEFCAGIAVVEKSDRKACGKADWKNDEPTMTARTADFTFAKKSTTCETKL